MIKLLALGLLIAIITGIVYLFGYAHGHEDGIKGINKHPDTEERFY